MVYDEEGNPEASEYEEVQEGEYAGGEEEYAEGEEGEQLVC